MAHALNRWAETAMIIATTCQRSIGWSSLDIGLVNVFSMERSQGVDQSVGDVDPSEQVGRPRFVPVLTLDLVGLARHRFR